MWCRGSHVIHAYSVHRRVYFTKLNDHKIGYFATSPLRMEDFDITYRLLTDHIKEKNYLTTICARSLGNNLVIINSDEKSPYFFLRLVLNVSCGTSKLFYRCDETLLPDSLNELSVENLSLFLHKFIDFINDKLPEYKLCSGINLTSVENSELLKLSSPLVRSESCLFIYKPGLQSKSGDLCPNCMTEKQKFVRRISTLINETNETVESRQDPHRRLEAEFLICNLSRKLCVQCPRSKVSSY
eukprot:Pompholyxophrys_punicea_v1_NODE_163_length_3053_cov_6.121081.p1 type:complete len:242 gc:universal NODE_163_length_3053_cov_6.121081:2949-2224(-)